MYVFSEQQEKVLQETLQRHNLNLNESELHILRARLSENLMAMSSIDYGETPRLQVEASATRGRPSTGNGSPRSTNISVTHTRRLLQSEAMKPRTAPASTKSQRRYDEQPSVTTKIQYDGPETESTTLVESLSSERSNNSSRNDRQAALSNTFKGQVETYDPKFGQSSVPLQYYHTNIMPPTLYGENPLYEQQALQGIDQQQQYQSHVQAPRQMHFKASPAKSSSKIANFVIHDERYFNLPTGYREETTRIGPWQTSRKHFEPGRSRQSSAMVVGGLDAAMRLKKDSIITIDASGLTQKQDKLLPPDVIVHPTTMQTIAVPHQRRKQFQHNVQVESGASKKTAILEPRIIELDARKVSPRSGKKPFRGRDGRFHASSGWAIDPDYRDINPAEWTTTAQSPRSSYDPIARASRKGPINPKWGQWNRPTKLETVGPPPKRNSSSKDVANSPRLQYRRRCQEMLKATKGWDACKSVERTFCTKGKETA